MNYRIQSIFSLTKVLVFYTFPNVDISTKFKMYTTLCEAKQVPQRTAWDFKKSSISHSYDNFPLTLAPVAFRRKKETT